MISTLATKKILLGGLLVLPGLFVACHEDMPDRSDYEIAQEMEVLVLSDDMIKVRDYVMDNAVIAHRGSTYWVPEETEAAFRWARNIGADYLEIDMQRTSDGVLLALHDDNLQRTTNIGQVFPYKQDAYCYELTFEEIMQLDAGSWFNFDNPDRARDGFVGQGISVLEDVIQIAQGKMIERNADGSRKYDYDPVTGKYTFYYVDDPADNGNRPGVYIECKEPWMYSGMEQDLYDELDRLGWNIITNPQSETEYFKNGNVNTGNTNGRIVLQTFSAYSIRNIEESFKGLVPTCYLLWLGDSFLKTSAAPDFYRDAVNYAVEHKAHFTGPSISGAPNNYDDLLTLWQAEMTHRAGLKIHAYSFDSLEQMMKYYGLRFGSDENGEPTNQPLTDAMFTNRSEITIEFYINQGVRPTGIAGNTDHPNDVLDNLGY